MFRNLKQLQNQVVFYNATIGCLLIFCSCTDQNGQNTVKTLRDTGQRIFCLVGKKEALLLLNCPLVGTFFTNPLKLFNISAADPKLDLPLARIKSPFVDKPCLLLLRKLFNYAPESNLSGGQTTKLFQGILDMLGVLAQQAPAPIQIIEQMVFLKKGPLAICSRCIIKKGFLEGKLHYCLKKNPYNNCSYCQEQHNTCNCISALKCNVFKINFATDPGGIVVARLPAQCLY